MKKASSKYEVRSTALNLKLHYWHLTPDTWHLTSDTRLLAIPGNIRYFGPNRRLRTRINYYNHPT